MDTENKKPFLSLRPKDQRQENGVSALAIGAATVVLLFLPLLLRLAQPALDGFQKGVYTDVIVHSIGAAYYALMFAAIYIVCRRRFRVFRRAGGPLSLPRRGVLLAIILVTGFVFSAVMSFKLRCVVELGEKFTTTQLLARALYILEELVKLVPLVYALALMQRGCESFFTSRVPLPYAGVILAASYGVAEFFLSASLVPWTFIPLALIYGIAYIVSDGHARTAYFVCLALFLL